MKFLPWDRHAMIETVKVIKALQSVVNNQLIIVKTKFPDSHVQI